jgi:exosortase
VAERTSALANPSLRGAVLIAALLWIGLFNQLRVEWTVNPLYGYGWGVPLLMIYLFCKRWVDRPSARPKWRGQPIYLGALALLLLPVRLVQEANPDWRLVSWVWALLVVGLTLGLLEWQGGWPWLRHFSVPILIGLLAVPWPMRLETFTTQQLMQLVAKVTAEGLNWLGIGAVQQGNLIEVGGEALGVEEACSGVRSLHSHLLAALFVGELYRLSGSRRFLLVGVGLVSAVAFNMVRTGGLAWACAQWGSAVETRYHDALGLLMMAVGLVLIWWVGKRLAVAASAPSAVTTSSAFFSPAFATGAVVLAACWLITVELATQVWYRAHENSLAANAPLWSVSWPGAEEGFSSRPLPERTRSLLRSDEHEAGVWRRPDGGEWTMFFLRWKPGRMAAQLATGHTPDVCLAATGFRSVAQFGFTSFGVHGLTLPFNTYEFAGHGRTYFVFFCLVNDRSVLNSEAAAQAAENYLAGLEWPARWRAVKEGRRHGGQQVLEVAMRGYSTREQAQEALRQSLPNLIQLRET